MSTSYTLDPNAAKKAGMSSFITETGSYKGRIKVAFACTSTQGTEGMEIMFEDDNKMSADYLQIWTRKKDGTVLSGDGMVHAIMACTEQRNLTTEMRQVERNGTTATVPVFKELVGKRIGFLMEKEPYIKKDGTLGSSMVLVMPFEADTGRTAKEKLEKANAEALPSRIAMLKDRPTRKPASGVVRSSSGPAVATTGPEDDIPF